MLFTPRALPALHVPIILALGLPMHTVTASAAPADLPAVAPSGTCGQMLDVDLTDIGGTGSTVKTAQETTSDGIPVCSVTGTLAPEVNFQVLLPMTSWTQRYLQLGCGGLCGNITLRSGASSGCQTYSDGGFVVAATDMGHTGNSGEWGLNDTQRADFAYRSQHLTAETAKRLIGQFYGQDAAYSYFNGCSDGGREALMEAMRFPHDFDGVVAGAPAMLFQVQNTLYHGWMAASNYDAEGEVIVTSDKLPLIAAAVTQACDALDGVADGLVSQPALCDFDPKTLICAEGADPATCLTAQQADTVAKFYAGPQDLGTGDYLTAGQVQYGSELEWQGVFVADHKDDEIFSAKIVDPVLKYLAFETPNPDFALSDLAFTTETLDALRPRHPFFDATNADLSDFQTAGGKLILWHGLADPHISPANTLSLHNAMIGFMGEEAVNSFERLYFLPGVGHCGGGQGPSNLDLLTPMMDWVEGGVAPDAVMTSSTSVVSNFGMPDLGDGAPQGRPEPAILGVAPLPDMTRPIYPYPYTAAYSGAGNVTDGANWSRGEPAQIVNTRAWPGADLFGAFSFSE
ncbi:tannase/feruloyl esterase family alpha/beta hydrolase [Donghicola mangrovi]|uniref:Tannase/feruloyl esterase family alpha/beta hydrolase n=1 Tax=Donghicola mangrovi TaxID=2729614 RepID=A0A850Q2V6_9RHOB|nr:tannase/feruloyl esterase family alpha/beta hydrolase [Donghicola mangrovi]NVO23967.1 tannase/feruloyl esterase family alpha/beta hydrolase [Donghicola mangrovi]